MRQICTNAGVDGSVAVEKIKTSKKTGFGYDAAKDEYCDMSERGIIDPTKVTRSALQNATSVASSLLTTEAVVSTIKEPEPPAAANAGGGMGMM